MMQEMFAYAAVYVAEALITGVYLDYLFDKKRKLWLHLLLYHCHMIQKKKHKGKQLIRVICS